MDQVDPKTGSSGAGDGSAAATASSKVWKPVEEFLEKANTNRARAIQHICETRFDWAGPVPQPLNPQVHHADDNNSPRLAPKTLPPVTSSQFPTIVLSHVPLYRSGDTTCGPLRERGTAIPLQAGYQYQNVLTPLISTEIVKHLNPEEITMVYSGDDHDYCEIEHSEFTGRIKEITVKSMSWAMGVRKPGVQLVSLWNPVNVEKAMSEDATLSTPRDTVQNRMCLLPDQLGIFICYAQMLGLTIFVLLMATIRYNPSAAMSVAQQHEKSEPLLPTSNPHHRHHEPSNSKSSCVQNGNASNLSTRKAGSYGYGNIRASSQTSSPSKPSPPYVSHARDAHSVHFEDEDEDADRNDDWGMPKDILAKIRSRGNKSPPRSRLLYLRREVWRMAGPVLLFYTWLLWSG